MFGTFLLMVKVLVRVDWLINAPMNASFAIDSNSLLPSRNLQELMG